MGSSPNTGVPSYGLHFADSPGPICAPYHPQISETTLEVTQSTKEVDTARSRLLELRRSVQSLEIDLDALRSQVTPEHDPTAPWPHRVTPQPSHPKESDPTAF